LIVMPKAIPQKILIVRTDRVGDVLLSTPVIKNLREAYPHAHIAFMCRPYTKEVLEGNPYLDEIIVYDKYGKHKSFFASVTFSLFLRKKHFDWAVILHPTNRVHLVTFFANIPLRIGWNKKLPHLLTQALVYLKKEGLKHEMEYTLDILRALEVPIVDKRIYFALRDEDEAHIDKLLHERRVGGDDFIITVHPSASCVSKRWPQDYFCRLIELLQEAMNPIIVLVTSRDERQYAEEIAKRFPRAIDLRGALSLGELAALINRSALFISNDSGPVHIAASLNIPVISLFGRKDPGLSPTRWRPLGERSFYLHEDVNCSVCLAHNCDKNFLCLRSIKPESVFKLAQEVLSTV